MSTFDAQVFYNAGDPPITETTRRILAEYSGIPEDEIVKHIRDVRDRAWATHKYPCLGRYAFLNFSISLSPHYNTIVQRLKSSPETNLIDIGCCVGQDLRKLVFDGVPSAQLAGSELEPKFIELGYELFRDRETLQAVFTSEDFFATPTETSRLKPQSFDFIHAASFFHLFSWDEQVEAVARAIGMLKPVAGAMIFGRQAGVGKPGSVKYYLTRSGEMYRHDVESMKKCYGEAVERARVEVKIDVIEGDVLQETEDEGKVRYLSFSIIRV